MQPCLKNFGWKGPQNRLLAEGVPLPPENRKKNSYTLSVSVGGFFNQSIKLKFKSERFPNGLSLCLSCEEWRGEGAYRVELSVIQHFLRLLKTGTILPIRLHSKKSANLDKHVYGAHAAKFPFQRITGTLKMFFFLKICNNFLLLQRIINEKKIRNIFCMPQNGQIGF